MPETRQSPIQSLHTKHDVVNVLIERDGAGVSETADAIGKPVSTTHDYLRTLEDLGYVINSGGEYRVSTRFLEIGARIRAEDLLYATAKSEIDKLAADINDRVLLMKEEKNYGVILYSTSKNDSLQVVVRPGTRTFLHATGGGKAILSQLSEEKLEEVISDVGLDRLTGNTITDRETLEEELRDIRAKGYGIGFEEGVSGIRGIGVPITSEHLDTVGAVLAYGPANRFPEERLTEDLPQALLEVKDVIQLNVNYQESQP